MTDLKQLIKNYYLTTKEVVRDEIIDFVRAATINELRDTLFEALVPEVGKAETSAGEMLRAVHQIGTIYFTEKEKYFSGYGLEIAGSSAIYLSKVNKALETLITKLYPEQYFITTNRDKSYTNFVLTLEAKIVQLIKSNPELVLKRNTVDSRTNYTAEAINTFEAFDEIENEVDDL